MKAFIYTVIAAVAVVAVGIITFMVMGISGRLPNFNLDQMGGNMELVNTQEFDSAALDTVSIRYGSDRLILREHDGDKVRLEEYMSRAEPEMLARVDTGSGSLSIQAGERPMQLMNIWRCEVILYLPSGWTGSLDAETTSGSLRAEAGFTGEHKLAALSLRSGSGTVHGGLLDIGGDVSITASSGSVKVEGIVADGSIAVKSGSGSIHVDSVVASGDISVESSSGSIHSELLDCAGLRVKNGSGSIHTTKITASGKVSLESSSGSINSDRVEGTHVYTKSGSGSVRLGELNGEFELASSSGSVRVESGAGGGRATGGSGTVEIGRSAVTSDISLETSSGGCKLYLPQGAAFGFHARTTSGSIKTPDNGALAYNERGNEATGIFGGSADFQVEMRSGSGSVRLEWS